MTHHHSDLAIGFPHVPSAECGALRAIVSVVSIPKPEVEVQAVLEEQRRVPIGAVHAWRFGYSRSAKTRTPMTKPASFTSCPGRTRAV
jgi:hypothetical protein